MRHSKTLGNYHTDRGSVFASFPRIQLVVRISGGVAGTLHVAACLQQTTLQQVRGSLVFS